MAETVSFNGKIYNAEVFLPYFERIPRTNRDALLKSGVLENHPELRVSLDEQTGGNYLARHFKGRVDAGGVLNYDGTTNLSAETTTTYEQGIIVIGRMEGFTEKDFTWELTHTDFFDYAGEVIANYQDDVDQADLLAILKAFEGIKGVENHIVETGAVISATAINTAIQKACGDMKNGFALFICHSFVATQLENLNLLEYTKYTDAQGIQRDLTLATVNGKLCIIDDDCPYDAETGTYTSYILGRGAFDYCDCGAKTPIEVARDPATNGGIDVIYTRWRKVLAPKGISWVDATGIVSPTAIELSDPKNWALAKAPNNGGTYPEKAVYIAVLKTLAEEPETTDGSKEPD